MIRITLLMLIALGAFVCEAKFRGGAVRVGSNPGVCVSMHRAAIDPWLQTATTLSCEYIGLIPFPDLEIPSIGGCEFKVKRARISSCEGLSINYQLYEPNAVGGILRLGNGAIFAAVDATRNLIGGISQQDSANLTFSFHDAVIEFKATIGAFDNGIPNIDAFECKTSLGPANLNVAGSKFEFIKDNLKPMAAGFRPFVVEKLCAFAKPLVLQQVNQFLVRVPNVIDLSPKLSVKFHISPKIIGNEYVQVCMHEKIITDSVSPHTPSPFPADCKGKPGQIVICVSDAVANDVLEQAYTSKLLEWTINKNSIAPLYDLIRLICDKGHVACLGNVAPNLIKKYGSDCAMEIIFNNTQAPMVEFQQGKGVFSGGMEFALKATPTNGSITYPEATGKVVFMGHVKVAIRNNTGFAKAFVDQLTVNIDGESKDDWETRIKDTIKNLINEHINGDVLLKGLPLKVDAYGLALEDPNVTFGDHHLIARTGLPSGQVIGLVTRMLKKK